jgi:hypothetical protein
MQSLIEMEYLMALQIEDTTMDILFYEDGLRKEGSQYQLFVEKDYARYASMEMRLDKNRDEKEWEKERERAVEYCVNNYIPLDYNLFIKFKEVIDESENNGVIYLQGENSVPEFFFKSSAYKKTSDSYYIFHRITGFSHKTIEKNKFVLNSIHEMIERNKPIILFQNVKYDEAKVIFADITKRQVPKYKGDECLMSFLD